MHRLTRARRMAAAVVAVGAGVAMSVAAAGQPAAASALPYHDPQASGVLQLCDDHLRPVTSGSTERAPFVWRAVGPSAAPTQYAGTGRTATLYAYQPRRQVAPSAWSGQLLTSSARYTNPAHPISQATYGDAKLRDFLVAYPPQVDGLVQLRLYLDAPQQAPYTTRYDAVDLRISGHRWTALEHGSTSCRAGSAVSLETRLLPKSALVKPRSSGSTASHGSAAAVGVSRNGSSAPGSPGLRTYATTPAASRLAADHADTDNNHNPVLWIVLGAALLLISGLAAFRRHSTSPRKAQP